MANGSADGQRVKFEIVEICLVRKLYPALPELIPNQTFSHPAIQLKCCGLCVNVSRLETDQNPSQTNRIALGSDDLATAHYTSCCVLYGAVKGLEESASGQRVRLSKMSRKFKLRKMCPTL